MSDPISLLVSLLNKLFTQFFRKNFVFIAILMILLVVAIVAISKAITEIAPEVQKTINATSELVEKVSAVQEGFNSALRQIDSMQETIARIERIINRIPSRLLQDEVEEIDEAEKSEEEIEEKEQVTIPEPKVKQEITPVSPPVQVIQPRRTLRRPL